MLKFSNEEFEKVKSSGEFFYKSIMEAYCPYFKEKISFNAQGLEHLKFKQRENVIARTVLAIMKEIEVIRKNYLQFDL